MSDSDNRLRKPPRGLSQMQRHLIMGAMAAGFAGYAAFGVWRDDFAAPIFGSHHNKLAELHFHGVSAWIIAAALFSLAFALVILIVKQQQAPQGKKVDMGSVNAIGWISGGVLVLMMILNGLGVI